MFFNEWISILLFQKKPAELASTTLGEGLKHLVIASVIVGVLSGIQSFLMLSTTLPGVPSVAAIAGPTMIVGSIIGTPIGAVIGMLIGGGILHLFCMILGGKGSYGNYVGVLSKISAAISGTAGIVLGVLGILAALGGLATVLMLTPILGLIGLVVGLWSLVLTILATETVQQLSLGRAVVAVVVIPLVIAIVLAVLLGALIFAAIMAAVGSGAGLGTTGFAGLPF